jgi:hypothetical protein
LVVDLIGLENQSLPVLIFANGESFGLETGRANGRLFVEGKDAILRAMSVRHGVLDPHP